MEIENSLGRNYKLSDSAISDFMDILKNGRCFGMLEHKDRVATLSDEMSVTNTRNDDRNDDIFKNVLQKYPNIFEFVPAGYFHKEVNIETGEEEIIIDTLTSIDATLRINDKVY